MAYEFAIVDVFADDPYTGNPLAVILADEPPRVASMRLLAREFNQSETTFVLPATVAGADRRLRSFTNTGVEIYGAGHNALGAWWWLAESGVLELSPGPNSFRQEIGGVILPLRVDHGRLGPERVLMPQSRPVAGERAPDLDAVAAALGLPLEAIDGSLPVQVVSTGDAHLLVSLVSRNAVDGVKADAPALLDIVRDARAEGCYVFHVEGGAARATAYARFLNPTDGVIFEDPASGGAAGPLACHLAAQGRLAPIGQLLVEQGTAIGRRSEMDVRLVDGAPVVAGRCRTIATGWLR